MCSNVALHLAEQRVIQYCAEAMAAWRLLAYRCITEEEFLERINKVRETEGLAPLPMKE